MRKRGSNYSVIILPLFAAIFIVAMLPACTAAGQTAESPALTSTAGLATPAAASAPAESGEEERLIAIIQDSNSSLNQQMSAFEKLSRIADDKGISVLMDFALHLCSNPLNSVTFKTAEPVRDEMAEQLIGMLKQGGDIKGVIRTLGCIGGNNALEALLPFLQDKDVQIQWAAIDALHSLGDKKAAAPLVALLGGISVDVRFLREDIIQTLADLGDKCAVAPLIAALNNKNDPCLSDVVIALGKLGDEQAVKPLIALYPEADSNQDKIVAAIVAIGGDATVDDLIAAYNTNSAGGASDALVQLDSEYAVRKLVEMLETGNADMRLWAESALEGYVDSYGTKAAADAVLATLGSDDIRLYDSDYAAVLVKINSDDAVQKLVKMLQTGKTEMRKWAAGALAGYVDSHGTKAAADALLAALKRKDVQVVATAYGFFIKQGVHGSEPTLINALKKYGDETMADVFLNCGNDALKRAAEDWAAKHGYTVDEVTSYGNGGIGWGSRANN